ncbi:hypothetical protein OG871_19755 [Kitasatospora sp. NBC_00374]|uniref:LppU/SCO3897 family protein n=1 Tax=Kitasatospora sp. NBC_00374 TaxID=2975964 RepID=UPI003247A208
MSTPPPHPYGPPQYGAPQHGYPPSAPPPYGAPPQPGYGPPAQGGPGWPPPAPQPGYGQPGYGQQPPFGQPPQPQAPYGQAPQQNFGPQNPGPQGFPQPAPAPAAPKPRRPLRFWFRVVGVCLGVVVLLVGLFIGDSSPAKAAVGDCVHSTGRNNLDKVACTDPKADYTVLSRYNDTTDTTRCAKTPGTTAQYWGSSGRRWHKKKYVLCLGPHTATGPAKKS